MQLMLIKIIAMELGCLWLNNFTLDMCIHHSSPSLKYNFSIGHYGIYFGGVMLLQYLFGDHS
jgi:hypothetical protein